jgi:hypothetical protein
MVTAMNGIEKHAAFYRAYLADDRSLASVAGVLVIAIAIWLLFYLVSLVGPAPQALRQTRGMAFRPGYERAGPLVREADGVDLRPDLGAPHIRGH